MPALVTNAKPSIADKAQVGNGRYLIIAQIIVKAFSFILNAFMARNVGPSVFAIINRLDLITSFVLSLGRETMRMGLMRMPKKVDSEKALNSNTILVKHEMFKMAFKFVLYGWIITISAIYLFSLIQRSSISMIDDYRLAIYLYAVAAGLEITAEPFIVHSMHVGRMGNRVMGEVSCSIIKALVFVYLTLTQPSYSLAFSLGCSQLISSSFLFVYHLFVFTLMEMSLPRDARLSLHGLLTSNPSDQLVMAMYGQSVWRFIMAQADSLVLAWFSNGTTLDTEGLYGMASNYAGLFLRLVQAPLEETGYMLFASAHVDYSRHHVMYDYLNRVVQFDVIIGTLLLLFGTQYTQLVANWLINEREETRRGLSKMLSYFCFLIPVMAISGINEAFLNGTVDSQLGMQRVKWMNIFLSCLNILTSLIFVRWFHIEGLVMAGILNFAIRGFIMMIYVVFRPSPHKSLQFMPKSTTIRDMLLWSIVCMSVGLKFGWYQPMHVTVGVISALAIFPSLFTSEPCFSLFIK